MRVAGTYSFNNGRAVVEEQYPTLLKEIYAVIGAMDEEQHKTKESKEATMEGVMLYSPVSLNKAIKAEFKAKRTWRPVRVGCEYSVNFYEEGYKAKKKFNRGAFREMDFIKEKLGVEVQFGKYAFMVYNVCAKMTIFNKLGHIDAGVEIVPIKEFADEMSTGVSYFEQFVWDLETRGVSNIDIPVLVLGIAADWQKKAVGDLPEQIAEIEKTEEPA
jgi:hypothetical protein